MPRWTLSLSCLAAAFAVAAGQPWSRPGAPQHPGTVRGCLLRPGGDGSEPCFVADGSRGAAACSTAAAAAWAALEPAVGSRGGWHQLTIRTSPAFTDSQQAQALGWLEGWLTGGATERWAPVLANACQEAGKCSSPNLPAAQPS